MLLGMPVSMLIAIVMPTVGWSITPDQMEAKCKETARMGFHVQAKNLQCILDVSTVELDKQMSRQVTQDSAALWYKASANCVIRGTIAELNTLVNYSIAKDVCSLPIQ